MHFIVVKFIVISLSKVYFLLIIWDLESLSSHEVNIEKTRSRGQRQLDKQIFQISTQIVFHTCFLQMAVFYQRTQWFMTHDGTANTARQRGFISRCSSWKPGEEQETPTAEQDGGSSITIHLRFNMELF